MFIKNHITAINYLLSPLNSIYSPQVTYTKNEMFPLLIDRIFNYDIQELLHG